MQDNPYQSPGMRSPPADDLLGADFQPRPMQVSYEFAMEDLVAFNLYLVEHSPTVRRDYWVAVLLLPALIVVGAVAVMFTVDPFVLILMGVFVVAYVGFFLATWSKRVRKRIEKMVKEGKNTGVFGQRRLSISPEEVREVLSVGDSSRRWSAVEKIVVTDDYVFIYTMAVDAYILPRRAFSDELSYQQFLRSAQIWANQAAAAS